MRAAEGAEKRRTSVILSETYALAQQYGAHIVEPELCWVCVDRARMAAEQADDPIALASAAWIIGNGLRVSGYIEEALRMVADAADILRPQLEGGSDRLRGTFGSLCLHAAVTAAQDGRDGDAWRWHGEAARTATKLGGGGTDGTEHRSGACCSSDGHAPGEVGGNPERGTRRRKIGTVGPAEHRTPRLMACPSTTPTARRSAERRELAAPTATMSRPLCQA
ncbi:hypothetical protein [Streptomyces sp. NPDC013489]|uniref:hypothetical protein n=1 Tax=Streptomyces sp. NPDC013489 TaxID=3155606 RepID=UPI0033C80D11